MEERDSSIELKVSMEESTNRSLHLRKSVPDTQQVKNYTRNYRDHIQKSNHTTYDENLPSYPPLSEPETGMLRSSQSQGQNVSTTLDNESEDHGHSTHNLGQEDIYTAFEGQKKNGTEKINLVAQQGNLVRYIDKSGKVTQSEEGPKQCLEGIDQDKASTSPNILENQADDVSSVSASVSTAVEVVPDMEKCEICESGHSEPYQDMAVKPPGAKTLVKAGYGKSIADTKEKNYPTAHNVIGDQYVGAENVVNFHAQKQTDGAITLAMPKKKIKKLCEESIGGTNQHESLEEKTKENRTRVSFGGPKRHFEKAEVPSTYDNLKEKNKQATTKLRITNKKADEKAGKLKKRPNQDRKTQFGFNSLWVIILFFMFPMAQCHPTRASQESTDVSSSDPHIKPVTGSDEEWRVYVFCVERGLYGKDLNFKIGSRTNCELPKAYSYSNVTCDDKSMAILGSDKRAALITKSKNSTVFLEPEGEETVCQEKYETYSNQKNAILYALSKITPDPDSTGTPNSSPATTTNPNSAGTTKPNDKTPETHKKYWWSCLPTVIVVVALIACGISIQWYKKRQQPLEISSPGEDMELNTMRDTDGTPNGINGHAPHNGISS